MTALSALTPANEVIEHSDLTDKTYDLLRRRILSGRHGPGDRLQITTLSEQLGVSHTPVKIALNRLAAEGLVEKIPRHGMFVARLKRKELEETQDVRLLLEIHAVETAVRHASDEELAGLRRRLEQFNQVVELSSKDAWDAELAASANQSFHEGIIGLVGNQKLLEVWRGLQIQQQIALINSRYPSSPPSETLAYHQRVMESLERRDAEAAKRSLVEHINHSRAGLLAAMSEWEQAASGPVLELEGESEK